MGAVEVWVVWVVTGARVGAKSKSNEKSGIGDLETGGGGCLGWVGGQGVDVLVFCAETGTATASTVLSECCF